MMGGSAHRTEVPSGTRDHYLLLELGQASDRLDHDRSRSAIDNMIAWELMDVKIYKSEIFEIEIEFSMLYEKIRVKSWSRPEMNP